MSLLKEIQILLKHSSKSNRVNTVEVEEFEKVTIQHMIKTIKKAAKKGNNNTLFSPQIATPNIVRYFKAEGFIVWDNDYIVKIIAPVE